MHQSTTYSIYWVRIRWRVEVTDFYGAGELMQAAVRWIDSLLRIHGGIYEFSQDSEVILRIQLMRLNYSAVFDGQTIFKGEPVLALHVWNERMPMIPITGADLEWALRLRRHLIHSFKELARLIQSDTRYERVRAITGTSALFSFSDHTGGIKMMQRLGFTVLPYHRPLGHFGEFWENLFSWWLMWTYNNPSINSRNFWRLQRTEIWVTRDEFIRRFGR